MPGPLFDELIAASLQPSRFVLGIISGVKGSTPQKLGAKALFFEDGRIAGTLGGGCLEAEVRKRALESLRTGQPSRFELVLDHDFGWDDGLICGGKVACILIPEPRGALDLWRALAPRDCTISWGVTPEFSIARAGGGASSDWLYRETVSPREHLWIAGAGHIAQAVAPLALQMDFAVTVFDDRPALASPELFPKETRLRVDYWEKLLAEKLPDAPVLGLVVTRGHQHDALVLANWVNRSMAFLGMIGSRRKRNIIFNHFIEEAIATREQLDHVVCPVGLPIGGISVNEIALSIVAQLVQNRSERRVSREAARNISPKPSLTSPFTSPLSR